MECNEIAAFVLFYFREVNFAFIKHILRIPFLFLGELNSYASMKWEVLENVYCKREKQPSLGNF